MTRTRNPLAKRDAEPVPGTLLVIQYEQFFTLEDIGSIQESVRETLEVGRQQGGMQVVGSFCAIDDRDYHAREQPNLEWEVPAKTVIKMEVD